MRRAEPLQPVRGEALIPLRRAGLAVLLLGTAAALLVFVPRDRELRAVQRDVGRGHDLARLASGELARFLLARADARASARRITSTPGCLAPEGLADWWEAPESALHLEARGEAFVLRFEGGPDGCHEGACRHVFREEVGLSHERLQGRLQQLGCAASAGRVLEVRTAERAFAVKLDGYGCAFAVSPVARPGDEPSWVEPEGTPVRCALDPERYRLAASGPHWDVVRGDAVVTDLVRRYPDYFAVVLDPEALDEPNLRAVRDDLERPEVDRRNFDALNSIAIGYFELNYRAQTDIGGHYYLPNSFRAAKLVAVPWRAYGEIADPRLRDAILDFFEDAATGEKLAARETAGRLAPVITSLEPKESEPARLKRIRRLLRRVGGPS